MTETLERELGVSSEEFALFDETAHSIGLSGGEALRVMLRRFNTAGGFPFSMRASNTSEMIEALLDPAEIALLTERLSINDSEKFIPLEDVRAELRAKGMAS
ncbi:MAG: hypothetical protein IKZ87_06170 [Actinomycetaceae bacterium]|nr:hypothetical protein [Actinomycetaceae bacterium]